MINDHAGFVLKLLNIDRSTRTSLCDFVIRTTIGCSYPVHKCVIGVISGFFQDLFLSQQTKDWRYFDFPRKFNPNLAKLIVTFAYGEDVELHMDYAYDVLYASEFFKIPRLQELCKNFLVVNLQPDNILKTWECAQKYNYLENFVESCEHYMAENLQHSHVEKCYLDFDFLLFKRFIQLKRETNLHESLYACIVNWINHDFKERKVFFKYLYDLIDVEKIADSFFDFIILANNFHSKFDLKQDKEDKTTVKFVPISDFSKHSQTNRKHELIIPSLVKFPEKITPAISKKRTKLHEKLRKSLRETIRTPVFRDPCGRRRESDKSAPAGHVRMMIEADEFIVVGGEKTPHAIKKFNVLSKSWFVYPDLEDRFSIDAGLAFIQRGLYIIGGRSKDCQEALDCVHCVEFQENTHECKLVASLHEPRYNFGCTIFDHKIYVAGGISSTKGCLTSVECYSVGRDEWEIKPPMLKMRGGCSLICKGGVLFAIGGKQNALVYHRSVELYNGMHWKMGSGMTTKRCDFAVVLLQGDIYAIGGRSADNAFNNSVEKRDAVNWKAVAKLNTSRAGHSACALDGKIYVAGGWNANGPVNSMEVYDPLKNVWEDFGEILGDPIGAAMTSVSSLSMLNL